MEEYDFVTEPNCIRCPDNICPPERYSAFIPYENPTALRRRMAFIPGEIFDKHLVLLTWMDKLLRDPQPPVDELKLVLQTGFDVALGPDDKQYFQYLIVCMGRKLAKGAPRQYQLTVDDAVRSLLETVTDDRLVEKLKAMLK